MQNMILYVLDKNGRLQPMGVPGELCLSGAGVARGYLNRPQLTSEKFAAAPHAGAPSFGRIYRTGDLVRWLPDGNIEFFGRMDLQVKVRGFRIEPGEIENHLLTVKNIKEAVVIAGKAPAGGESLTYLHAYIVPGSQPAPTVSGLRDYLSHRLPDYMIPSHFVQVENIPLTPGGKIDRKALESFGTALGTGVDFVAPQNAVEKRIAEIWKHVLGKDKIGIHENFFDLGGTSLDIFKVTQQVKELFGRDIPVISIFRYTTVYSLARYLAQTGTGDNPDVIDDRTEALKKGERAKMNRRKARRGVKHERG